MVANKQENGNVEAKVTILHDPATSPMQKEDNGYENSEVNNKDLSGSIQHYDFTYSSNYQPESNFNAVDQIKRKSSDHQLFTGKQFHL